MDTIKIVGTRETSFTAADGKQINGTSFYYIMQDENVTGLAAGRVFISSDKLSMLACQPAVGQSVQVVYNRYGKVDDFVPAQGVGEVPATPAEKAAAKKG